jgi:predicted GNAT family N-acyltransferase
LIEIARANLSGDWEACKAIRFEVFVDEQQVPFDEELDIYDATARHWLARLDGKPVGTCRVVELPDAWKVGRVAVCKAARGHGVGLALMQAVLAEAREARAHQLVLESQVHAMPFYEKLGYLAEGPEFLDCNIPHRKMRLQLLFSLPQ